MTSKVGFRQKEIFFINKKAPTLRFGLIGTVINIEMKIPEFVLSCSISFNYHQKKYFLWFFDPKKVFILITNLMNKLYRKTNTHTWKKKKYCLRETNQTLQTQRWFHWFLFHICIKNTLWNEEHQRVQETHSNSPP